jgi:hypothetical protein
MWTRGTKARQEEAPEALLAHVELDEGRKDGVVLDVEVAWRRHRHQRFHPGQWNETT